MRRGVLEEMIRRNGRGFVFDNGCSIYNFVGGMLKRNHKIMFSSILQEMEAKQREHKEEGRDKGHKDIPTEEG